MGGCVEDTDPAFQTLLTRQFLPGYCSGMFCRTPKELFDLLLSDYESYLEIQRTKGHRDVTEEDKKEIAALCQSRLEKWEKGNAR